MLDLPTKTSYDIWSISRYVGTYIEESSGVYSSHMNLFFKLFSMSCNLFLK